MLINIQYMKLNKKYKHMHEFLDVQRHSGYHTVDASPWIPMEWIRYGKSG